MNCILNYLIKNGIISFKDAFCDEDGKLNNELPVSKGTIVFTNTESGTKVEFKMNYPTGSDIEKIVEMGF